MQAGFFMPFRSCGLLVCGLIFFVVLSLSGCVTVHPGEAALVHEVARETGQRTADLNALLSHAHKQQAVLDAISRPFESKPWSVYQSFFLTNERIHAGVAFYLKHRRLLERVADRYGVEPGIIVATLGVETYYCQRLGHYKVLDALVTLGSYYPPREKFFRHELKALLELPLGKRSAPLDQLVGSYAGAQGCAQFMPTSIRDYAVHAGDQAHLDLYRSFPDIFSSVANYFVGHGWVRAAPVASPVRWYVPSSPALSWQSVLSWPAARLKPGSDQPLQCTRFDQLGNLLTLKGKHGLEYWTTFGNFWVITSYNPSVLYAMTVYQLAQAIDMGVQARLHAYHLGGNVF